MALVQSTITVVMKSGVERSFSTVSDGKRSLQDMKDYVLLCKESLVTGLAESRPGGLYWGNAVINISDIAIITFDEPIEFNVN